jgi:hypothetical protein
VVVVVVVVVVAGTVVVVVVVVGDAPTLGDTYTCRAHPPLNVHKSRVQAMKPLSSMAAAHSPANLCLITGAIQSAGCRLGTITGYGIAHPAFVPVF